MCECKCYKDLGRHTSGVFINVITWQFKFHPCKIHWPVNKNIKHLIKNIRTLFKILTIGGINLNYVR